MLMEPKKLSDVTFHSITKRCRTDLLSCYNPKSMKSLLILLEKKLKASGGIFPPQSHHPPEFLGVRNSFFLTEPEGPIHSILLVPY